MNEDKQLGELRETKSTLAAVAGGLFMRVLGVLFWMAMGAQVAFTWHAKVDMEHANASAHQLDAVVGGGCG